ncbi:hypothetical protein PN462_02100 [Spirulina sp. CS-785/01]|uniref:hypothetical protein n=1 Tax=Spirulina sp. CS-785/01 TaxID=3021716 RepID=UPI0023303667|nr:hypothetical protein [Spirulina sp. CS-785/01]MDB9311878.1 hypothetical protein [Spirulina sp. CS-785/01]
MNLSVLEQCYRVLALPTDASLEEIESAYLKQVQTQLSQGEKGELHRLQKAYETLKAHYQQKASEGTETEGAESYYLKQLQQRLETQGKRVQVDIQGDCLRVMFDVRASGNRHQLMALTYHVLQQIPPPHLDCIKVYGMKSKRKFAWREEFNLSASQLTSEDLNLFSFKSRLNNILAFPLALILAVIINNVGVLYMLFLGFHIWIHEFGHSTMAWLSGHRSLPLPIGVAFSSHEPSLFVYFGLLILFVLLFYAGSRNNQRFPMILAVSFAILQFILTWLIPDHKTQMLITFGGVAGEFYLSTFLMASFYFSLPDKWRWDAARYLVLVIAASSFWHSFWFWTHIKAGQESIPFGSLLGGRGDSGGDMNKLIFDYHWNPSDLVNTYTGLGNLCLLILVGLYGYFLIRQNKAFFFGLKQRVIYQLYRIKR